MTFEKLYNELYAVVSIRYFWSGYQDGFVKSESPDWINEGMGFGLEVSQALLQNDGEARKFVNLYLGKKREEIPGAALERFSDRAYFYNGRFWALYPDEEPGGGDYIRKAVYRFGRKLEKLSSNYTRFPRNGLYLFLHTGRETENGVREIYFQMEGLQKRARHGFQLVFLCSQSAIYVLDFQSGEVEAVPVPPEAAGFLEARTESLRLSREWKNGESIFEK